MTTTQSFFFSLFTLLLYAVFLAVQTIRHQSFFTEPSLGVTSSASMEGNPVQARATLRDVGRHTLLLIVLILPIVLLAKQLAKLIDYGFTELHAPAAIGGVFIALIVFSPEGMSALRAALDNRLQRPVSGGSYLYDRPDRSRRRRHRNGYRPAGSTRHRQCQHCSSSDHLGA